MTCGLFFQNLLDLLVQLLRKKLLGAIWAVKLGSFLNHEILVPWGNHMAAGSREVAFRLSDSLHNLYHPLSFLIGWLLPCLQVEKPAGGPT